MVACRQVELLFYSDFPRQHGRRFDEFAQAFMRTAIPFLGKNFDSGGKRVTADLFEHAVPEIAEVVSGGNKFRTAAKCQGRWNLRKEIGSRSKKEQRAKIFQENLKSEPVCREEAFLQTFLFNHFEKNSLSNFCGSFWRSRRRKRQ